MDQTEPVGVFRRIVEERNFQDRKYGPVTGTGGHSLEGWLLVLESELNEAKKASVHGGMNSPTGRDTIRAEILQIAAVAVAALEQHGVEQAVLAEMFIGIPVRGSKDSEQYNDGLQQLSGPGIIKA